MTAQVWLHSRGQDFAEFLMSHSCCISQQLGHVHRQRSGVDGCTASIPPSGSHSEGNIYLQSYTELVSTNLTKLTQDIHEDCHLYWYTAEYGVMHWPCFVIKADCSSMPNVVTCLYVQSSLSSEVPTLSFEHLKEFHHRHYPATGHTFMGNLNFVRAVALDMFTEVSKVMPVINCTINPPGHRSNEACSLYNGNARHVDKFGTQQTHIPKRQQRKQQKHMPRHFFINDEYRSSNTSGKDLLTCYMLNHSCRYKCNISSIRTVIVGLVNPAAVYHPGLGWILVVMPYGKCFESTCNLQVKHQCMTCCDCTVKLYICMPSNLTQVHVS